MRSIYPKIDSKFRGVHVLKKYIDKYKGLELQILCLEEGLFTFEEEVRTLLNLFPNIKEITIHPPTDFCELEKFLYQGDSIILQILEKACTLSSELSIHINILFHVGWSLETYKKLCTLSIRKMLNQIRGYHVYVLLENIPSVNGYDMCNSHFCIPLELCKFFGEKQLKVCLNISHMKIDAKRLDQTVEDYIQMYIKKEDTSKYVYQIHFSALSNHEKMHGIMHQTRNELMKDIELLYQYGMYNCNFITGIRENNYDKRAEQVKEIELLEDIYEVMKRQLEK